MAAAAPTFSEYPIVIRVEPDRGDRNRLTVAFRIILAIPHALLVGGPILSFPASFWGARAGNWLFGWGADGGVIGAVAFICAVISWFAILFANQHPRGLWDLAHFYMRWRTRAGAYMALFRDEYPPFGDGEYAATFETSYPEGERDKLSVGLRLIYAVPHFVLLFFLNVAWALTTIVAWFAILFTGRYPDGLLDFGLNVFRWNLRVEAYTLLMRDEYPPFSLQG